MAKAKAGSKGPVKKDWGLYVYIAGDNNLSDNGLEDIEEMCQVGASPAVHVGVEIDTLGEFTGSVRYELTEPDWEGQSHRIVISRLKEKDTGDPKTLTNFVKWGHRRYPARNRLLVVWNHGSGFRAPRRDIGYDDFGSSLDMPEVETALKKSSVGQGYKEGKLSILAFDACLMCMVEIAHHFKGLADFLVGSQQTEPGDGWPYDRIVRLAHGSPSAREMAAGIVSEYITDYRNFGVEDVTQSAIDLAKIQTVVDAMHRLGKILADNMDSIRDKVKGSRVQAQAFEYADYVDLIHIARLLRQSTGLQAVKSAADHLIDAVQNAVVASKTFGASVSNAKGLSVWFPADPWTFFNHRAKYLRLRLNEGDAGWLRFLDAYFA